MTVLLVVIIGVTLWILVPLPMAVAVGRAFRAGEVESAYDEVVRRHDTVRA